MKISELVSILENFKYHFGDLEVLIETEEYPCGIIESSITYEQAKALYDAFFTVLPGAKPYGKYIQQHINYYGYAQNLFHRKYYGINGHKGKNYCIQGSGADYIKELAVEIDEYIESNNLDIHLFMFLHDELAALFPNPVEKKHVLKIKEIMERLPTAVKMLVDVEVSTTNWKEKKDYVT